MRERHAVFLSMTPVLAYGWILLARRDLCSLAISDKDDVGS